MSDETTMHLTAESLYRVLRPAELRHVCGQTSAVSQISAMMESEKVSQNILFTGPSGTGKTTLARILAIHLLGEKETSGSLFEYNCANSRGIDFIRELTSAAGRSGLRGSRKVFILDECHQLTAEAQDAALKLFEDVPKNVYFFLCTSEPARLKTTLRTRSTPVTLSSVSCDDLREHFRKTLRTRKKRLRLYFAGKPRELSDHILGELVEAANGSVRSLWVLYESIAFQNDSDALTILRSGTEDSGEGLAKLLFARNPNWTDIAKSLTEVTEVESTRRGVLGYASAVVLKTKHNSSGSGNWKRAHLILMYFEDPTYNTGKAGLTLACMNLFAAVNGLE